jgi:hypothetical protein
MNDDGDGEDLEERERKRCKRRQMIKDMAQVMCC